MRCMHCAHYWPLVVFEGTPSGLFDHVRRALDTVVVVWGTCVQRAKEQAHEDELRAVGAVFTPREQIRALHVAMRSQAPMPRGYFINEEGPHDSNTILHLLRLVVNTTALRGELEFDAETFCAVLYWARFNASYDRRRWDADGCDLLGSAPSRESSREFLRQYETELLLGSVRSQQQWLHTNYGFLSGEARIGLRVKTLGGIDAR